MTLANSSLPMGKVYLVGAGPGDPDLLTVRAFHLLQNAQVVLYDRLVAPAIVALIPPAVERIYVGKTSNHHPIPQEEINTLLVHHAQLGRRVVRLKGGDPFIFGRGGEEIQTLKREGIAFEIVPGVTAALGCAAYAGIPLTHRDYAHTCILVTGHLKKDGQLDLNWTSLAQMNQTLVFYMGLQSVAMICEQLIMHGLPADMPAAVIRQGTTPMQYVKVSTLRELPRQITGCDITPPSLLIVGEVVQLQPELAWFPASVDC